MSHSSNDQYFPRSPLILLTDRRRWCYIYDIHMISMCGQHPQPYLKMFHFQNSWCLKYIILGHDQQKFKCSFCFLKFFLSIETKRASYILHSFEKCCIYLNIWNFWFINRLIGMIGLWFSPYRQYLGAF